MREFLIKRIVKRKSRELFNMSGYFNSIKSDFGFYIGQILINLSNLAIILTLDFYGQINVVFSMILMATIFSIIVSIGGDKFKFSKFFITILLVELISVSSLSIMFIVGFLLSLLIPTGLVIISSIIICNIFFSVLIYWFSLVTKEWEIGEVEINTELSNITLSKFGLK